MRFFAFIAALATTSLAIESFADAFSQEEKEALFEVWTAQAESGELSEEAYYELAQALDGNASPEWYAEVDRIADQIDIPEEFYQMD